jgi:transcriptional regulator with PAS, ATPase and Fis domain
MMAAAGPLVTSDRPAWAWAAGGCWRDETGQRLQPPAPLVAAAERALATGEPRTCQVAGARWLAAGASEPCPYLLAVRRRDGEGDGRLRGRLEALAEELERSRLPRELATDPLLELAVTSPSLGRPVEVVRRIAPTTLPLLVLGETGTGKELLARAVHRASGRRGAFVAESCAALPETLLEAELFGVRRGAFTGATADRRGRVQQAHRGTLFLDEVGDLPLASQVKLLRVLQEKEVRPLGADRPEPVDIRVVAATLRNLPERVREGRFRQDLYFRLAGMTVRLPPLEQRRGDLPYLAAALLARAAREGIGPGRWLDEDGLRVLALHRFAGNVRELDNLLRRGAALSSGRTIPATLLAESDPEWPAFPRNLEERAILEALERAGGVKAVAARQLGWSRQKLYRRLSALGLPGAPSHRACST